MAEAKTKEHVNFYENIKEANMRLRGTVVLYDGLPHAIMAITAHNPDGIFRVYMEPLSDEMIIHSSNRPPFEQYPSDHPALGPVMDEWMANNPKSVLMRKMMNSPKFNKFRPFPLGMCNYNGRVYYLERQPTRKSEQGLTSNMIAESRLRLDDQPTMGGPRGISLTSPALAATIRNEYPSFEECLTNLKDRTVTNEGAAFHRLFALIRGPINTMFLGYKDTVIGVLPHRDGSEVILDVNYYHTREAVQELGVFANITVE